MGIFWTKYASIRELMRLGPVRSCWWMFVPKYSSFVSSKWKISRSSFVALSRYCSPLDLTNKTVIRNSLRCRPASPDKILPLQQPEMRGKITPNLCLDKLKISQPLSLNWPSREWENKTKPCWLSVCLQSVCQDIFKLWEVWHSDIFCNYYPDTWSHHSLPTQPSPDQNTIPDNKIKIFLTEQGLSWGWSWGWIFHEN